MIRPRFFSLFSLRAVDLIEIALFPGLSSTYIGASDRTLNESLILSKSASLFRLPVLSFQASTCACAASIRSINCWALISSEKINVGTLSFTATLLAISSAKEVLPIEGRAARMMRSDFWNPDNLLSKLLKPVGTPRRASDDLCNLSNLSQASLIVSLSSTKVFLLVLFVTLKIAFSASSRTWSISCTSLYPRALISSAALINPLVVCFLSTISA